MSVQPSAQERFGSVGPAPAARALMRRHRVARAKLERAFDDRNPVVLMIGADNFELGRVIGLFLGGLDAATTVVRLRKRQESALDALRQINQAIGFEPKDLTVPDLQNVFAMFLQFQRNHGHRTVLCVEKADEQSMWLLDCVARLINTASASSALRNLFVIVSGSTRLTTVLQNSAFDAIRQQAGTPIRLAPFSVFETREFVRQISKTAGIGDIQNLFEFDALERLHRISGGIPYIVARLFRESVAICDRSGRRAATAQVVAKAARNLRAAASIDAQSEVPTLVHVQPPAAKTRRLLIRCPERPQQAFVLRAGRFMVGRAGTADIRLPSASVSRRHALLIDTGEAAQLLDLGGLNGTRAGGERIAETELTHGLVLTLGDCEIEYSID